MLDSYDFVKSKHFDFTINFKYLLLFVCVCMAQCFQCSIFNIYDMEEQGLKLNEKKILN